MSTEARRFGPVAIALHWAIALLVIGAVAVAWVLEPLDAGEAKDRVLTLHKSVGLLILALTCIRLVWRLSHRAPALPQDIPAWQRVSAWVTHACLYAMTLALPVTGYLSVAARGRETTFFGLFAVPQLAPLDRSLSRLMEQVHGAGQYVLYALLAAHVGAALYHRFVLRDGVLSRMWPFGAAPTSPRE